MSPWSRERHTAWISPRGVVVASRGFVFARTGSSGEQVVYPAGETPWTTWDAPLQALDDVLRSKRRRGSLDVVLSDHFVRYLALPWNDQLRGEAEWRAYALHSAVTTFGERATRWVTCLACSLPGDVRLAAFIDEPLLRRLRDIVRERAVALGKVEPSFCRGIDRHRREMRGDDLWFVTAEPDHLCAGRIVAGVCVRAERVRHDVSGAQEALAALLARSAIAEGRSAEVPLYFRGARPPVALAASGSTVRVIGKPAAVPEPAWALGLA